ncbi:hypothetical protein [Parafrankia elaeagni]|uniref:hypothetical protein n=1 Tax=Parafrankia elaeagni TaxID=222534 RepID=UPI000368FFBE|nr:hypothetical protein [Parafrankia elaeagni]
MRDADTEPASAGADPVEPKPVEPKPVEPEPVDAGLVEGWHRALLALAGVLPDELVTRARGWLAEGRLLDLTRAVTFALVAGRFAAPGEVVELLGRESGAAGADNALLGLLGLLETAPADPAAATPWRFCATEPGPAAPWAFLPLDLTAGQRMPLGRSGAIDRAMIEAVRAEPGAAGLWRAWRLAAADSPWPRPRRVFVVTARPADEPSPPRHGGEPARPVGGLAAVAGRLQAALAAVGEPDPQVEVCPAGGEAPAYQVLARTGGALLWAREPAVPISVARVFDEVDPQGGPRFAVDRPRVDGADRARIAAYLDAGVPVLGTSATMIDVVEPARGVVVPLTFRTDGSWVWTDTVSYYLTTYGLTPDPDLLRHALRPGPPDPVDEVALHRVLADLLRPEEPPAADAPPAPADPVWYVPGMSGGAGADTATGLGTATGVGAVAEVRRA